MIVIAASKSSGIKEIFFFFFLSILLFAVCIQNKEKRWPTKICYLLNATSIIISRMESSSKYFLHVEQPVELARFSLNYQWVVLQDEKLAHFDIAAV